MNTEGVHGLAAARSLREALLQRLRANSTVIKFLIVGGTASLIYQSVLFAVYDWPLLWFLPEKHVNARIVFFDHGDVRLLIGTLVASELGIIIGFTGHHLWTFRNPGVRKRVLVRFGQYHTNQLISTLGILTLTVNVLTVQFGFYHFVAVPIGVAAMGAWNWTWDSQFIWRRAKRGRGVS